MNDDVRLCTTCTWFSEYDTEDAIVVCIESPRVVKRPTIEPCRKWASHRGLSAEWADKSKMPAERAARYKCLCMDAKTIMTHILGNTTILFREQRARIAQWEKDLERATENDVDVVK